MPIITEQIRLDYRLIFDAPFHFGTGLRRGLIHRTVAKDHSEYLIVPGTTIKGVVRERCEQLGGLIDPEDIVEPHDTRDTDTRIHDARRKNPDIVTQIFGSRFRAGPLFFDDAHLADFATDPSLEASSLPETDSPPKEAIDRTYFADKHKLRQVETRTQVSLSRLTRTAKSGHLYTSEYGIRQLCFEGCIYGYLEGPNDFLEHGTYALLLLVAGLRSVDRLGGMKSTGAGEVSIQITRLEINGRSVDDKSVLAQLKDIELYQLVREENS